MLQTRLRRRRRVAAGLLWLTSLAWDAGTKLLPPDGQADDIFGIAVAASGGVAIVGAVGEDRGDGNPAPNAWCGLCFR
jgi:hypothetical protein